MIAVKTWKKAGKGFLYLNLFLAAGLSLTHCTFSQFAKKSYSRAKRERPYDAIIVPGVPYEGEKTTAVMKMRLFWAKHLYDSGFTRNIIFSGSSVYSPYIEGKIMEIMADSLGIPEDQTFAETRAEHSTENVYFSWKLAQQLGFKKIALATDPFQAGMLKSFMRRYCPEMRAVPIVFGTIDLDDKKLPVIDPSSAYVADFVSITERLGFWQRFRATMGKRVKEEIRADQKREKEERNQ